MGNSASSKLISAAEDNKIKVVKKILARYTEQQRKLEAGMKISDKKIIDINYGNKVADGMLGAYQSTVSLPRSFICVCVYPVHVYRPMCSALVCVCE